MLLNLQPRDLDRCIICSSNSRDWQDYGNCSAISCTVCLQVFPLTNINACNQLQVSAIFVLVIIIIGPDLFTNVVVSVTKIWFNRPISDILHIYYGS